MREYLTNIEVSFVQLIDNQLNKKDKSVNKIRWKGTQKELAELIIELYKKEWIEGLEYGKVKEFASTLITCFELTKNAPDSNWNTSIYQLLKPQQSKQNQYESIYPQVYTQRYKTKFDGIKYKSK